MVSADSSCRDSSTADRAQARNGIEKLIQRRAARLQTDDLIASAGQSSTAACCFRASGNLRKLTSVGCDGSRNCLVINELPLAPAGDEVSFAQDLEMVRDSRGRHAAHRDDLATVHVVSCRDCFKDPEAGLVGKRFRYLLHFRTVHTRSRVYRSQCAGCHTANRLSGRDSIKPASEYFDSHLNV